MLPRLYCDQRTEEIILTIDGNEYPLDYETALETYRRFKQAIKVLGLARLKHRAPLSKEEIRAKSIAKRLRWSEKFMRERDELARKAREQFYKSHGLPVVPEPVRPRRPRLDYYDGPGDWDSLPSKKPKL